MDEIKNASVAGDNKEEIVESEEVLEVALAEEESESPANKNDEGFEYTDGEISGLTPQQKRRRAIFDKITTGILIFLMASPLLIVLYIFLWFILK